jgi:heme-degrading monooxygenase HmoA
MDLATHATITLARFNDLQEPKFVEPEDRAGVKFLGTAADVRSAYTGPNCTTAFKFATYGIHESEESANRTMDERAEILPWLADATETWSAVLRPIRHYGECNFVDPSAPGEVYSVASTEHPADAPLVVVTSVGWEYVEDLDMERLREFSAGVNSVRIGMSGIQGLHSQQTFSFPSTLQRDGITVTFWRNFAAMRDFAYGSGIHKHWMKRQRDEKLGDRTSFTRFAVVRSEGTWHGVDPLAV